MDFENWLIHIGKSKRTAKSYAGALSGVMSIWAKEAGLTDQNLDQFLSANDFIEIVRGLEKTEIYQARNTKGKNMYSSALKAYTAFIADISNEETQDDILVVLEDQTISTTEKSRLINARVGQGKYRRQLIELWEGCAITGYQDTRLLVASHIKPWRSSNRSEKLDPFNGLLLLPNLDKAFDLGFITFKQSGEIVVSSKLENQEILDVRLDMRVSLEQNHQEYMTYHRDVVFENKSI